MQRGFTLIELIVSVAIFAVVMVIALGALLSMSVAERKAETIKAVMNNLNFSLDSMSRTMRVGSGWGCGQGNCNGVAEIRTSIPTDIRYRFEQSNATLCGQAAGTVGCITRSTDGGASFLPVTAPEVVITSLEFYMIGMVVGSPDNTQPKLTMTLSGYVNVNASQQTPLNLQTSVTQRLYDQ